jgi:hypothetical protein
MNILERCYLGSSIRGGRPCFDLDSTTLSIHQALDMGIEYQYPVQLSNNHGNGAFPLSDSKVTN